MNTSIVEILIPSRYTNNLNQLKFNSFMRTVYEFLNYIPVGYDC